MKVGSNIGQYRILSTIGAGGMGTVYLAEHILLGRHAAIKTLLPTLSVNAEIVERFFTEARAASAISDPGIVQIFDFGYHVDGTAYIVMELIEGESLSERLARLGRLTVGESLRIARQVAGSLASAHAENIIHRDLKPENVFLTRDAEAQGGERVKIIDFGICKRGLDADDGTHTETGTMLGTPVYMSPEQCRGAGGIDHRTDIYALGCVLFHMITGRTPFVCDAVGEFIVAHLCEEPPIPSDLMPEIPPMIDALLLRCLAKSPDDRFASMAELHGAIEQALARLSSPGMAVVEAPTNSRPLGTGSRPLGTGSRHRLDGTFTVSLRSPSTAGDDAPAPITPMPTPSGFEVDVDLDSARHTSRQPWRQTSLRAALAILIVGVIGGLIATTLALAGDEAIARAARETPTLAAAPGDAAPLVIIPPAILPIPAPVALAAPAPVAPEASTVAPATRTVARPATKPIAKRRPAGPRQGAPKSKPASAAAPIEDLYDTR